MRIVLDTNILARANPSAAGPARQILIEIAGSAEHVLIVSAFLLRELERVLGYPRLQSIWPLDAYEIAEYVQALESFAELVQPRVAAEWPQLLADPGDDPVLQTALIGRADMLCTLDRHFYTQAVLDFCRGRGLSVCTDVELLRRLRRG